jgi:serine/threonine protein kinase
MGLYNFLRKILVWEPEKRLTPQQALQDPWITKGLPSEIKELYTIFSSTEYTKKSKKGSKDSKHSKHSNSKKSKERPKGKEYSDEKKRQFKVSELRSK